MAINQSFAAKNVGSTSMDPSFGLERSGVAIAANNATRIEENVTRKMTRPDAPRALAKVSSRVEGREAASALALETATSKVNAALSTLVDVLAVATPEVAINVHAQLKHWDSVITDIKKITSETLKDLVATKGTQKTEKGSKEYILGKWKLEIRPHRTGLDGKKVEALIREKDLSVDELMDKVIVYKMNESRLAIAVAAGDLTADELKTCEYETTYSFQPPKLVE